MYPRRGDEVGGINVQPALQVCPVCGYDDEVKTYKVDDDWVMICEYQAHLPYEWRPAGQYARAVSYRTGLGEELGVYDTLLECVTLDIVEYGVVEHLFSQADPTTYKHLVERYGHRTVKPSKYTVSSFLGGALGHLWREELIGGLWGPATGCWSSNGVIGCYVLAEGDEDGPITSWVDYVTGTLGVAPGDWPALGYVAADHTAPTT
jgi:hypothetical protein